MRRLGKGCTPFGDPRVPLYAECRILIIFRRKSRSSSFNKPEFYRGWHDKQRRECNFHHTEQSKETAPIFEILFDVLIKSPIKEILGCLCRLFGIRLARKPGWVQR